MTWSKSAAGVLGSIAAILAISVPARAGDAARAAEPLYRIQVEHVCECRWAGWCDSKRTWFKTVRYAKRPDRSRGCFASAADEQTLEAGARRTCRRSGFEGLGRVDEAGCQWSLRHRFVAVEKTRPRTPARRARAHRPRKRRARKR